MPDLNFKLESLMKLCKSQMTETQIYQIISQNTTKQNIIISLVPCMLINKTSRRQLFFFGKALRSAIYSPTWHERLFRRKRIGVSFVNFSLNMDHIIDVKGMQELDNAAGSYLNKFGNIISVADWAYFPLGNIFNGRNHFSHKSVVTALGVNENLVPADGSYTLDMKSLGLMYENYSDLTSTPPIKSNHYGYPNLGRPVDHFSVTPFEAIYVDNTIDPHIKLEEANAVDRQILTDFIKNEVEPWYLSLQNDTLGAQAHPNYLYKSNRIAKYNIVVGHLVTPKTDPGDYVVAPNADLQLKAGQAIDLFVGTTILEGSRATLTIEYLPCPGGAKMQQKKSTASVTEKNEAERIDLNKEKFIKKSEIRIFPNPSNGSFTIANMQDIPFDYFEIYDFNGKLVLKQEQIGRARYECKNCLTKGLYILHLYSDGVLKQQKISIP